jgi:ubiquinone/menaquinone biosynthesis C-methylase UbiE
MDDFTGASTCVETAETFTAPPSTTRQESRTTTGPEIPDYLQDTYYWAYINPRNVRLLDREIVVRTILWQQHNRLQRLAFAEIEPGQRVMQPASVYGSFGPNLARHVGPEGQVDIVDVARVQVDSATRKLEPYPWARAHHANCLDFDHGPYDVVVCYFLLHEVPDEVKRQVVNHLLGQVERGGKVVFVDYAKPKWWHPLKPITSLVFDTLEPFAKGLWRNAIRDFADDADRFAWRRETIFASLFQKVVATRTS